MGGGGGGIKMREGENWEANFLERKFWGAGFGGVNSFLEQILGEKILEAKIFGRNFCE